MSEFAQISDNERITLGQGSEEIILHVKNAQGQYQPVGHIHKPKPPTHLHRVYDGYHMGAFANRWFTAGWVGFVARFWWLAVGIVNFIALIGFWQYLQPVVFLSISFVEAFIMLLLGGVFLGVSSWINDDIEGLTIEAAYQETLAEWYRYANMLGVMQSEADGNMLKTRQATKLKQMRRTHADVASDAGTFAWAGFWSIWELALICVLCWGNPNNAAAAPDFLNGAIQQWQTGYVQVKPLYLGDGTLGFTVIPGSETLSTARAVQNYVMLQIYHLLYLVKFLIMWGIWLNTRINSIYLSDKLAHIDVQSKATGIPSTFYGFNRAHHDDYAHYFDPYGSGTNSFVKPILSKVQVRDDVTVPLTPMGSSLGRAGYQ